MGRVPGDNPNLWRGKNKVDMGDVVRDVVLKSKSKLNTECEPAVLCPVRFRRVMRDLLSDC